MSRRHSWQTASVALLDRLGVFLRRFGFAGLSRRGREVVRFLTRDRLVVGTNGLRVVGSIEHRAYLEDIRRGRDAYVLSLLRDSLPEGGRMIDVGAYIGVFSLVGAQAVGLRGDVLAFEPDPRNLRCLIANVDANGMQQTVAVTSIAASDAAGIERFYASESDASQSALTATGTSSVRRVLTATIDALVPHWPTVDVVKVDVEGHEVGVLSGMAALLDRSPDVRLILENNPGPGRTEELFRFLTKHGFNVQRIDEAAHALRPVDSPPAELCNLYCRRK